MHFAVNAIIIYKLNDFRKITKGPILHFSTRNDKMEAQTYEATKL